MQKSDETSVRSLIPVISLSIVLFGCNMNQTKEPNRNEAGSEQFSVNDKDESFETFFDAFNKDSLFQISRIDFPVKIDLGDLEEDASTFTEIDKGSWTHLDLHYEDSCATREIDKYTQEIIKTRDTVRIEIRGIDNGIFINFIFIKKQNQWKLAAWEDFST